MPVETADGSSEKCISEAELGQLLSQAEDKSLKKPRAAFNLLSLVYTSEKTLESLENLSAEKRVRKISL